MINTREELIIALAEAAEIEHGLLVQYLFAAFSMKRREDEGITPAQQMLLMDWERVVLKVAHEEMYHLANVFNLLAAIGGTPHLGIPSFPKKTRSSFIPSPTVKEFVYYPFDFQLEPFNENSIYRFIISELPEGQSPPKSPKSLFKAGSPDPLVYNHIGQLYELIASGFARIPEKVLFVGQRTSQDQDSWGLGLNLMVVNNLQSAVDAITAIVKEGEGTADGRAESHYGRFCRLRYLLTLQQERDPNFTPSRNIVCNPRTRANSDVEEDASLIDHGVTLRLARLFNDLYSTMLIMLMQYYSFGGETQDQRNCLKNESRHMMSSFIRPLAEMLTEMPVKKQAGSTQMAGACFEVNSPLQLSRDVAIRWIILNERFKQHIDDCNFTDSEIGKYKVMRRIYSIKENIGFVLLNLQKSFEL